MIYFKKNCKYQPNCFNAKGCECPVMLSLATVWPSAIIEGPKILLAFLHRTTQVFKTIRLQAITKKDTRLKAGALDFIWNPSLATTAKCPICSVVQWPVAGIMANLHKSIKKKNLKHFTRLFFFLLEIAVYTTQDRQDCLVADNIHGWGNIRWSWCTF